MDEKNNVRIEFKSIILSLEYLNSNSIDKNINIYTDSASIINLTSRRSYLEANSFFSRKNKTILPNADIYREFFNLYDKLKPNLIWIKGHSPKEKQTFSHKNFSYIDKLIRKKLRDELKQLQLV